jgi:hypothetical protein
MAALDTVQDYLDEARALLLDSVVPYRYSDADIVAALNISIIDAAAYRPDLFMAALRVGGTFPSYSASSLGTSVVLDSRYRQAHVFYIVGTIQLRDAEDTQDARALAFLSTFASQLLRVVRGNT